jgi:hypothetical protein
MTDLTVPRSALGPLQQLGKGGTAMVYRTPLFTLPGFSDVVYKEYKKSTRTHAGPSLLPGMLAFARFRETFADQQRRLWDERIVWPLRVVVDDDGAATGILMRLIAQRYFQPLVNRSGERYSKPREVDMLFGSPGDIMRTGMPAVDLRARLSLISQVAATYAMMHKANVVVGDISGRNVIFDPTGPRPNILVVDADSARVAGTRSVFSSQPHTPHWEPPEALLADAALRTVRRTGPPEQISRLMNARSVQNKATDVYKFALMAIRILDCGRGRSINRDPSQAATVLRGTVGASAAAVITRCLADEPQARPPIREVYETLNPSRRTPAPAAAPPAPLQPTFPASPAPAMPEQTTVGSWHLVEGTGWVRHRP